MIQLLLVMHFVICGVFAQAEVLELEGIVKSVDATARTMTVERKTAKGTKTLELEVTKKAGDLTKINVGDSVRLTYDPDLEVVTGVLATKSGEATTSSEVQKGEPINLIPKQGLQGWRLMTPLPEPNWLVADDMLVCIGAGSDLLTEANFDDFEMTLEFLLPPKCNSGIYLRDRYELSLLDSEWRTQKNEPAPPNAMCGAIYGKTAPRVNAYLGPSRWNKLYVRVLGNTVSARLNGKAILEDAVLTDGDELVTAIGPFRLQYHTNTAGAKFRNWIVTPLTAQE